MTRDRLALCVASLALLCASCGGVVVDDTHSTISYDGPWSLVCAASPSEGGAVTAEPLRDQYAEVTTVTVTALAASGYRFLGWRGDLSGTQNPAALLVNTDRSVTAVFARRSWTIVVYMSADNELEANALQDMNELEAGGAEAAGITVLALLDRAPAHDTSDGDWTDTRLYRVRDDANGLDATIVSERLASPELGLASDAATELDMGNPSTLTALLAFAARSFPAEHLALVIWGHGTGWRLGRSDAGPRRPLSGVRVAGFDDSSAGDPLYTAEIAAAMAGSGVEVLGLDVCLGAMLETAYELRECAQILVASEDVTSPDGWEYHGLLQRLAAGDLSRDAFVAAAVDAYAEQYATTAGSTISALDLGRIGAVNESLNAFSDALWAAVSGDADRLGLRQLLFSGVEDFYVTPGDLNLDLVDLADVVKGAYDWADAEADALKAAVAASVLREWHHEQENPRAAGLAVHYVPLDALGMPVAHDEAYIRGRTVSSPLAFVSDSTWVPNLDGKTGLLYRLWY
jgi:hypothetical protein